MGKGYDGLARTRFGLAALAKAGRASSTPAPAGSDSARAVAARPAPPFLDTPCRRPLDCPPTARSLSDQTGGPPR